MQQHAGDACSHTRHIMRELGLTGCCFRDVVSQDGAQAQLNTGGIRAQSAVLQTPLAHLNYDTFSV